MIFRLVVATFLFLYVTALTSEELGWAEVASELKDWVESIPKVSVPLNSYLKSDEKNSAIDVFDSFYLQYSVEQSAKDCSGKVASVLANRLNYCMVKKGKGYMQECGIDFSTNKVYLKNIVYPDSLTCDQSNIPDVLPSQVFTCGGIGTIPNTYVRTDCSNQTASEIYGKVSGLTIQLYGSGHSAATCVDSEFTNFASWNGGYCQPHADEKFGNIYRTISCSKSSSRVITKFFTDAACTRLSSKPGKNIPVPPFGHCYDASLLIPNSDQKMIPVCSFS